MNTLGEIISALPAVKDQHSRDSNLYRVLEKAARLEVEEMFRAEGDQRNVGPLGTFVFPYFKMGAVDSLDLFGLDELILFSFYWANRNRYKKVLDIGANIGLHTTVLAKAGYDVQLFEPDPVHFAKLKETLQRNNINNVQLNQAAVSRTSGELEFVRVLGNTTSSHIAGSKNPYGDVERFQVPVFDIRAIIRAADLIKMDVEGHEAEIITATQSADWDKTDAVIEVGTKEIAKAIYDHLQAIGVHAYSQKRGWQRVEKLDDMPTSYKEGSLFISKKSAMPWS